MDKEDVDILFKVVIIGDTAVGKTQILNRALFDQFDENSKPTLGVDFKRKDVDVQDKRVRINLWDTAGQERYKAINQTFYSNAQAAILVFDITRKDTFNSLEIWLKSFREYNCEEAPFIIIGNKTDLEGQRLVPTEELAKKAEKLGALLYIEVSAKNDSAKGGLENTVKALADEILTVFRDEYDTNYENSSMSGNYKQPVSINSSKLKKTKKSKKKVDDSCC